MSSTLSAKRRSDAIAAACQQEPIVAFLQTSNAYPHEAGNVEVKETHISWVFLAGRFAYKLKKPVAFDFLDFGTVERRRRACLDEVQLNRRLAGEVYLGVVPITFDQRLGWQLGGSGEPRDWLVKMLRLPAMRSMDQLIANGQLQKAHVEQLARSLAQFYNRQPPLVVPAEEYRRRFERHIAANGEALLAEAPSSWHPMIQRIQHAQTRLLKLFPEMLEHRVCDGRVIEGHGDLRPEHIYFTTSPVIIDCIEFNAEYRQLDVLDELAFLAMECDYLGAPQPSKAVLEAYRQASGDAFAGQLVAFYKCYRACVRAKVALLAYSQHHESAEPLQRAERLLGLASKYADELGPPWLIVVSGESGTGKSTLAAAISGPLALPRLQTDLIRRELFGESHALSGFGQERYAPARRGEVYDELFRRAESLLAAGASVILDGTFLAGEQRARVFDVARAHGASPLLIRCRCLEAVAQQRIEQRGEGTSESEARPEFHALQRTQEAPPPIGLPVLEIDTSVSSAEASERVFAWLADGLTALAATANQDPKTALVAKA